MIIENFKKVLKDNGCLVTTERLGLFEQLRSASQPLTIATIVLKTQNIMDQTTVYRNLDLFEKLKITHKVYQGWKYKIELSDNFHKHHHHLTCTSCGKVVEFNEPSWLDSEVNKIAKSKNFLIQHHMFELRGLCSDCKKSVN